MMLLVSWWKNQFWKTLSRRQCRAVIADETADRNKQEVMSFVLRCILQHRNVWEIHESLILLFDSYRENDAYLADFAQPSNHVLHETELYGRPVIMSSSLYWENCNKMRANFLRRFSRGFQLKGAGFAPERHWGLCPRRLLEARATALAMVPHPTFKSWLRLCGFLSEYATTECDTQ